MIAMQMVEILYVCIHVRMFVDIHLCIDQNGCLFEMKLVILLVKVEHRWCWHFEAV